MGRRIYVKEEMKVVGWGKRGEGEGRVFFFFKQKTAYEIKECDWSSDVCSSDLERPATVPSEQRRIVACRRGLALADGKRTQLVPELGVPGTHSGTFLARRRGDPEDGRESSRGGTVESGKWKVRSDR